MACRRQWGLSTRLHQGGLNNKRFLSFAGLLGAKLDVIVHFENILQLNLSSYGPRDKS